MKLIKKLFYFEYCCLLIFNLIICRTIYDDFLKEVEEINLNNEIREYLCEDIRTMIEFFI